VVSLFSSHSTLFSVSFLQSLSFSFFLFLLATHGSVLLLLRDDDVFDGAEERLEVLSVCRAGDKGIDGFLVENAFDELVLDKLACLFERVRSLRKRVRSS
jgi:hypothetical protein